MQLLPGPQVVVPWVDIRKKAQAQKGSESLKRGLMA